MACRQGQACNLYLTPSVILLPRPRLPLPSRPLGSRTFLLALLETEDGNYLALRFARLMKNDMLDPWNVAGVVLAASKLAWDIVVFWKDAANAPEEARKFLEIPSLSMPHGRATQLSGRKLTARFCLDR